MEFRILGPLEVIHRDEVVDLGSPKQRAVLAMLLTQPNKVVSVDRLIDQLWAGQPPGRATGTLQAYLSNLRRTLEPDRPRGAPPSVLVTQPPGYLLRVEGDAVDAVKFERLVSEARAVVASGDFEGAGALLREALSLWRGPALADFAYEPFAEAEIGRLEELRLGALEDRVEADLALGRHAAVIADLEPLVAADPLRERFRCQLMLALYRCGRQAEALRVCREGRRLLADELGIDPSPALQRLEQDILRQSPGLDWQRPAEPSRARPARRATGGAGRAGCGRPALPRRA